MCGRFSLRVDGNEIRALHGYNDLDVEDWVNEEEFVPRYNIAPRSQAPVIRRRDPVPSESGSQHSIILQTMKWGLVPHWSKFEDKSLNTTNARSENLVDGGGMWASIKGKKRCAIPCQGYYEWLTRGKDKLPHFIKRKDGNLLLMAGLYDSVELEGRTLWTFAIVTTDANREFSWLHDRQPVFLSNTAAVNKWLDTSPQVWTADLTQMVKPYNDTSAPLDCYQVPKEVGKVGTESPSFIEPITSRKDGIQAMFSKQKSSQSKALTSSSSKRSRSQSPTVSWEVPPVEDGFPPLKKSKMEEGKPKPPSSRKSQSPKKKTRPAEIKKAVKITSFFTKV
ncbi:hypothetical protein K443DRAFT_388692 [Laccaria amethystina LaAM-08-1]|uniref:DUF159-domain-containing protein n=1 Tax=Laccaria amethystina LaAM-08-1 TaxID=1095629 RepID=A0A0C9YGN6_9AGAR|nr:hypothetical protein K443DRAFT_388692 [Laccaria amethystina LaAM-08-1]